MRETDGRNLQNMGHAVEVEAITSEEASEGGKSQPASVQAAIARTATRSVALFFARPVRLFRPSKVNGWQTLKNLAGQQGETLSHQYLFSLVKIQGIWIIPKHFVPPMVVNAMLGTILWTSYGEASLRLEPVLPNHAALNVMLSGAIAGACQAVAAAPAENVRMLLEHGFGGHSWSCAWKEVFREKINPGNSPTKLQDARQLRGWLHEVGQMAGRGWNGWGWGLGKDTLGFSAFFLIFEFSRRAGSMARDLYTTSFSRMSTGQHDGFIKKQLPAVVNSVILVTGGVVAGLTYEFIGKPWDVARRTIHLKRHEKSHARDSSWNILRRKIAEDGVRSLFESIGSSSGSTTSRSKWNSALRTAGRVGPWGVGFLVWEAYSSGLT